jgi:hypothetical protein
MSVDSIRRHYEAALEEAKAIARRQDLNDAERTDLHKKVERIEKLKAELKQAEAVDAAMKELPQVPSEGPGPASRFWGDDSMSGTNLQQAYLSKGWDIESRPKVNLGPVLGQKALMADGSDANIQHIAGISSIGADARFAYPSFPSVSLGNATSLTALVQTVRTLATPTDMDVSLTGSTTKPESVVTAAPVTVDAIMIAHVTELIPNALFKLPSFSEFIQREMSFGLGRGIDSYLLAQLAAASGTVAHSQGTDTLFATYRNAIRVARAEGYSPNLAVMHPNDAADLDLLVDNDEHFYGSGPQGSPGFPSLWGMKVVESVSATEGYPILVDTQLFGKVYFGALEWAVNPFEEFRTNRSRGRLEVPMAVVVQQAEGIVEITLA